MSLDTQFPTWSDVTNASGNTLPSHSEMTINIVNPDGAKVSLVIPADDLTLDQLMEYVTIAVRSSGFTYVERVQAISYNGDTHG